MKPYCYTTKDWTTFTQGNALEWTMTNGLGSYGGASLIGAQSRTHHGYLIASLHSPTNRFLILEKVSEEIVIGDTTHSLHTSQYRHGLETSYVNGQQYLAKFTYDGTVSYEYRVDDFILNKKIALKRDQNVCAIHYHMDNPYDIPVKVMLTPFFNFREHSTNSVPEDFHFTIHKEKGYLTLIADEHPEYIIGFSYSEGELIENPVPVDENVELAIEVELETEGLDSHYCPYQILLTLMPHTTKDVSIMCEVSEQSNASRTRNERTLLSADAALTVINETKEYYNRLLHQAGFHDLFAQRLVLSADFFLTKRNSTNLKTVLAGLPWFTDWGRDTMIAFTGLTLCTKRFVEAREILLTFAKYIRNGIVPNMFPDDNTPPLYNTADASLLYFYAVERYLHYDNSEDAYEFVRTSIFQHLKEILAAYEQGTDNSIYMDSDCLIHAGSGLDQVTWMDVRVGEWVPTPRHGKPVEINAYWYNALKVMEMLCTQFGEDSSYYRELADKVALSFCAKFWNEKNHCLYDVIDGDEIDDSIRPNQIYAVSLPYTMLSKEQALQVVNVVHRELFVGVGLRSLAPNAPAYHSIYCGSLPKRDAAYHQGTAWGFLLGGFFTAYRKVHDYSEKSRLEMLEMLKPIQTHLTESGCIGSISEIFDGDSPHHPRGCYAQAWSVGEILRSYVEDILTDHTIS